MIPKKLKTGKEEGLNQVLNEVRENFLESLKKSLARQTLKKPDLPQLANDDLVAPPEEPRYHPLNIINLSGILIFLNPGMQNM